MVTGKVEEQCGYASMEHGALFVITTGIYLKLEWCAENWDTTTVKVSLQIQRATRTMVNDGNLN